MDRVSFIVVTLLAILVHEIYAASFNDVLKPQKLSKYEKLKYKMKGKCTVTFGLRYAKRSQMA